MEAILNDLTNSHPYLIYAILFAVIFLETGLIFAAFLPGDTLILMTGILASNPNNSLHIVILMISMTLAAMLGPIFNYASGYWFGKEIMKMKRYHLLDEDNLKKINLFYEKWGALTNIFGRFVAFVRTFAPFVAGLARMNYRSFIWQNIIGAFLWINSLLLIGYFSGKIPLVSNNLDKIEKLFMIMLPMVFIVPIVKMLHLKFKNRTKTESKD